jgi:hypothetical protein
MKSGKGIRAGAVALAASLLLAGSALAGCSESDEGNAGTFDSGTTAESDSGSETKPSAVAEAPSEAEHVHGLAVDPGSGDLLIASHSGLWRVAEGAGRALPVGDTRHDLMGFTVAGPGNFLASGHPAPGSDLPPLLGLMRSSDGGRSWNQVSLLGEADFHVLVASGDRVYGIDSVSGELFISDDAGRSWERSAPPATPYGLAAAPGDPDRLVLTTDRGTFGSDDAGKTWAELSGEHTGLVVWPERESLYLVDGGGEVMRSDDGGRTFEPRGSLGGTPESFGSGGGLLLAALHGGEVWASGDGGRTWQVRVAPG